MCVNFISYALKISALIFLRNYYAFLSVQIIAQVTTNILVAARVNKMYPEYLPAGNLSKEKLRGIAKRVSDLFTSSFSSVISNSADTVVISKFLGLTTLAIYQNYYFIISSLKTMIEVISGACTAGVGNSLITESPEKNYRDLKKMTVLMGWLMAVASPMLLCMYQPFMVIWMGEERLLEFNYVICFVIYFYSIGMNKLINMFKDAAGIWAIDKWRPLTAALVNIGLNLATVQWLGLYGVLLSTVVSIVLVQIPWLFHNLFKTIFPHEHLWSYVGFYCCFVLMALTGCVASWFACSFVHLGVWPSFFINAVISFITPNVLFLVVFGRNSLFKESVTQVIRVFYKRN
jgi:O-antigen/teichoic acid export membrane protein